MKIKNLIYILLFTLSITLILKFSEVTLNSISSTIDIYLKKVFPSLFLFIFFTNILLESGLIYELSESLKFIPKLFKLPKNATLPILLGFLCGFPSASNCINKLYKEGKLNNLECSKLMSFCNNASPIFIISTIGYVMLGSKEIGIKLFVSHVLSSIIIAIFTCNILDKYIIHKNYKKIKYDSQNIQISTINNNFLEVFSKSISLSLKTMLNIFSYMLIFDILADIINSLNISNIEYLTSPFELTKGISNIIYTYNLPYISFLLGFSSFSVLFQIKSSLTDYKYSFSKLVIIKCIHGLLSMLITYIII